MDLQGDVVRWIKALRHCELWRDWRMEGKLCTRLWGLG